ncbi:MAG: sulfatase/phosphatase domain-containing protein, partial [Myxococcota bacterium]
EHGRTLHPEMLDTPLLIKLPGQREGRRIAGLAEHVDILPTLLDLVGVPAPEGLSGHSLMPRLRNSGDLPDQPAIAHVNLRQTVASSWYDGEWKLIAHHYDGTDGYPQLFYRPDDPSELDNLAWGDPERAFFYLSKLQRATRDVEKIGDEKVDPSMFGPEMREQMKALGYID